VVSKRKAQNLKADYIITEAKEKAREIELEAKDVALRSPKKPKMSSTGAGLNSTKRMTACKAP
jgi:hypothetical protein